MRLDGYALGLLSQTSELSEALPVEGRLPEWLQGQLIRTVPSIFEVGETNLKHWFDGLAALYSFTFNRGKVFCRSKILRSKAYEESLKQGRLTTAEFATNPRQTWRDRIRAIVAPPLTDNGNVNVVEIAGRYLAMTEIPKWLEFNPETLAIIAGSESRKEAAFSPTFVSTATAHPHKDPLSGKMINIGTHFGARSRYVIFETAIDAVADRQSLSAVHREIAQLPTSQPGYLHSFAITENYIILFEFPLLVKPTDIILSGKPYIENFHWSADKDTRILVVNKQGELCLEATAPATFSFHHINAFEQDGQVIVDLLNYENADIIEALYLEKLRTAQPVPAAALTRYTLNLLNHSSAQVTSRQMHKAELELPRINYARNGKTYSFTWCAASTAPENFLDCLIKLDLSENGEAEKRWYSGGCYPGEPVFVARPGAGEEDDGVILSTVLNSRSGTSFLLVLDARSMAEVARLALPLHIPLGFHGQFFFNQTTR